MAEQITEQTEQAAQPASISITDLQNTLQIIDYACDQGAFKGWNVINQVAQVRERLRVFLEANAPAEAPEQAAEENTDKE